MQKIFIFIALFVQSLCVLSGCASSSSTDAFSFRSLYTPTNASEDFRKEYGTSHVDYDWDLWGHNLKKIVGSNPRKDVFATVADTLCERQYCFSSDYLYHVIEEYILDQYGEGTPSYSARICIMPQDNKIACVCPLCRAKGNTENNATPAVTDMLTRLANRFPLHHFFTSSYHSTRQAPSVALPSNVGVLMSAIDLPYRVDFKESEGCSRFTELVKQWQTVAQTIYVWDYERNYDDYLSPFPCLMAMQSRFKLYHELGINGVFINGSGDDYSAFDDMQSAVIAQLLKNPDISVEDAVRAYLSKNYPQTADLIADYYLGLERRAMETNHVLPLYGSMQEMVESYIDPYEFTVWRANLDKASKSTQRPERQRLNYLLTSLAFTQLRIFDAANANLAESYNAVRPLLTPSLEEDMVEVLKGHNELNGMKYYSESLGDIDKYIKKHLR